MAPSVIRRLTSVLPTKQPGTFTSHTSCIPEKDIEQGSSTQPSQPGNPSYYQTPPKLSKFQNLVGIQSTRTAISGRPAPNPGIYKRTVDEESSVHFHFLLTTYIVNVFFMLQIIVGAALTALGAAKGPPAVVTVLGAVNTIIAGILTYLKGQGLPTRLEQNLHLLRTLREHIEEREREFTEPDCTLDVDEVVQSILQMYKEVRQTAEDNTPGTVLPPKGAIASLVKKTEAGNHVPTSEGMGGKSLADRFKEAESAVKHAAPVMSHGLEDLRSVKDKAQREIDVEQGRMRDLGKVVPSNTAEVKDSIHPEKVTRDQTAEVDEEVRRQSSDLQDVGKVPKASEFNAT